MLILSQPLTRLRLWSSCSSKKTKLLVFLGKALSYTDNNWKRLEKYVEDPRLPIDNNPAEQMIRPIALGRKNWLFFGSERGGEAAANLMSLIATCKRASVAPLAYLNDVFKRLPSTLKTNLDDLLPGNWKPLS